MIAYAMYKGRGALGNALVRLWKRTIYSHCELLVDGVCYSSSVMDGGVRAKQIDLNDGKWDVIPVPWVDKDSVLAYFDATKGQRYSWMGIVASQIVAAEYDEPRAAFCSEWVAAALGIPTPQIYAPESLGQLVSRLNCLLPPARQ